MDALQEGAAEKCSSVGNEDFQKAILHDFGKLVCPPTGQLITMIGRVDVISHRR